MSDTASVTIKGVLSTSGGTLLSAQPIAIADSAGNTYPAATTGTDGSYSSTATIPAPVLGLIGTAKFAGAPGYNPSTGTTTATNINVDTTTTATVTQN